MNKIETKLNRIAESLEKMTTNGARSKGQVKMITDFAWACSKIRGAMDMFQPRPVPETDWIGCLFCGNAWKPESAPVHKEDCEMMEWLEG